MGRCESQESLRGGNEVNDENKPSTLMAKMYETVIRPLITYGA